MPVNQETRPMRRLPNPSPRIPHKLWFPIFLVVGIDLGLLGLLLVLVFTPVNPNYPIENPIQPGSNQQSVQTVSLPSPNAARATMKAPQTTPVHQAAPATRKPSATRTAVPIRTPSAPAALPAPSATPSPSASQKSTDPVASPSSS